MPNNQLSQKEKEVLATIIGIVVIVIAIAAVFFELMRDLCGLFLILTIVAGIFFIGTLIFFFYRVFSEDEDWIDEIIWPGIALLAGLFFFILAGVTCSIGYSDMANKTIELNNELQSYVNIPNEILDDIIDIEKEALIETCKSLSYDECQEIADHLVEGVKTVQEAQNLLSKGIKAKRTIDRIEQNLAT